MYGPHVSPIGPCHRPLFDRGFSSSLLSPPSPPCPFLLAPFAPLILPIPQLSWEVSRFRKNAIIADDWNGTGNGSQMRFFFLLKGLWRVLFFFGSWVVQSCLVGSKQTFTHANSMLSIFYSLLLPLTLSPTCLSTISNGYFFFLYRSTQTGWEATCVST